MSTTLSDLPSIFNAAIRQLLLELKLPNASAIAPFSATAEFHSIYVLTFPTESASKLLGEQPSARSHDVELILRVAANRIPRTKTSNEVAVMTWIRQNTSIPVPVLVASDSTTQNALGHEFTLLEKAPGVSVDRIYDSLSDEAKESLVIQLAEIVYHLHGYSWSHVGGLTFGSAGEIGPGPVLEETFWQSHTTLEFWGADRTIDELNISGPYLSFVEYALAHLSKYTFVIQTHPKLAEMQAYISQVKRFEALVTAHMEDINDTRYILAHKDLHFANILCDPDTHEITAILDFEFAGVVPAPLWNPVRAFLWNGQRNDESKGEKEALFARFENYCRSHHPNVLEDVRPNRTQEHVIQGLNYLRAIIEVSIMGGNVQKLPEWKVIFESAVESLET